MEKRIKTYADSYIYNKKDTDNNLLFERSLVEFIRTANRVNKNSAAFEQIKNQVKARQTSAVLFRVLMRPDVVLCMSSKEAPASFKVFTAKDLLSQGKEKKVFVDVTGLFRLDNGYYSCKEIDKLCAYLIAVCNNLLYFDNNVRLLSVTSISKAATTCFVNIFISVLDNLRITNFNENRNRIMYIAGVYFMQTVVGRDNNSAKNIAAQVAKLNAKDAVGYDYWYHEEDLVNIDVFIGHLAKIFKLEGLTTDVFINRYMQLVGKGSPFGLEVYPSFLTIITNAYSGSFINNQKYIEKVCGKDMVTVAIEVLKLAGEIYSTGFKYEATYEREEYDKESSITEENIMIYGNNFLNEAYGTERENIDEMREIKSAIVDFIYNETGISTDRRHPISWRKNNNFKKGRDNKFLMTFMSEADQRKYLGWTVGSFLTSLFLSPVIGLVILGIFFVVYSPADLNRITQCIRSNKSKIETYVKNKLGKNISIEIISNDRVSGECIQVTVKK